MNPLTQPNLENSRIVTLSTAHVTAADARMLNQQGESRELPLEIHLAETGWVISTRMDDAERDFVHVYDELRRQGYSDDFITIMTDARAARFSRVLFDRDAAPIDGYPVHAW